MHYVRRPEVMLSENTSRRRPFTDNALTISQLITYGVSRPSYQEGVLTDDVTTDQASRDARISRAFSGAVRRSSSATFSNTISSPAFSVGPSRVW